MATHNTKTLTLRFRFQVLLRPSGPSMVILGDSYGAGLQELAAVPGQSGKAQLWL